MKINDLVDKFIIEPSKDIEPFFEKTREISVNASHHKGCFNCGDMANQENLKSASWTGVQYCWKCNHLNVIYFSDRMSGAHTDTVYCYTDSKGEVNKATGSTDGNAPCLKK